MRYSLLFFLLLCGCGPDYRVEPIGGTMYMCSKINSNQIAWVEIISRCFTLEECDKICSEASAKDLVAK